MNRRDILIYLIVVGSGGMFFGVGIPILLLSIPDEWQVSPGLSALWSGGAGVCAICGLGVLRVKSEKFRQTGSLLTIVGFGSLAISAAYWYWKS